MNLLITLPSGILLVILCFFILLRVARLQPLSTGFSTALLTLVSYVAFAMWRWPGGDVFAVHIALYLITVYVLTVISHSRKTAGAGARRLHWAPLAIVAFFLVVVSVDSVFIVLAQRGVGKDWSRWILPTPRSGGQVESHFPGIVSHDFREKEKQFNAYQTQRELQQARGWQFHIGWEQTATINQRNRLLLAVTDAQQNKISDARIRGHFLFPGNAKLDQVFEMRLQPDGLYAADLTLNRAGTWDLVLSISRNSEQHELRTTTTIENPATTHE
jgi:nitrogen fixation protein FixH